MSDSMEQFRECNAMVRDFERVVATPQKSKSGKYYTGVDLGTAYIVIAVLDEEKTPVAGAYRFASVVKDGLVVDFAGAVRIVRELKAELEEKLGVELIHAATAVPPGTSIKDSGAIRYVVEGAGFEVTTILDEPTAANAVLGIKNGAVVDVGGGTTGIAIFEDGKVVYTADEPTGGTHFSLVIAGGYGISIEDAEDIKKDFSKHREITPVLKPVVQKISSIIDKHIAGFNVKDVYLVGGTCCLTGIENIVAKELNKPTFKPENPMFITPLGIAMSCLAER